MIVITAKTLRSFGYNQDESAYFMRRIKDSFGMEIHNVREDHEPTRKINFVEGIELDDAIKFVDQYLIDLWSKKTSKPNKWKTLLNHLKRLKAKQS